MKWDKLFSTKIADINYETGICSATYVTQIALMQLKCQKITIWDWAMKHMYKYSHSLLSYSYDNTCTRKRAYESLHA